MIENKYQQPSFKFETNIAKYDVEYKDWEEGKEMWVVNVTYNSYERVIGHFELPISWSREYVFGWLSRMEINEVPRG